MSSWLLPLFSEVSSLPNREKRQEDLESTSADRTPLDKNTKDQSKIVSHIKELINNVVAENDDEVKVGDLQKPLEFYDTVNLFKPLITKFAFLSALN